MLLLLLPPLIAETQTCCLELDCCLCVEAKCLLSGCGSVASVRSWGLVQGHRTIRVRLSGEPGSLKPRLRRDSRQLTGCKAGNRKPATQCWAKGLYRLLNNSHEDALWNGHPLTHSGEGPWQLGRMQVSSTHSNLGEDTGTEDLHLQGSCVAHVE